MSNKGTILLVISYLTLHSSVALTADSPYKEGQLLVRFAPKPDAVQLTEDERNAVLAAIGGGTIIRSYTIVPGLSVVKLPAAMTIQQALQKLNKADGILYAEPDYRVKALSTFPNDLRFSDLWAMHNTGQTGGTPDADIDAPEAWDVSTGSGEIIVAVIDTGVDYNHPDLAANMWINEAEVNGKAGVDDDGNGYVDDIYGYDFCSNDADPMDDHYHGTHCAGTIGAVGNNGEGVAGVCWNVRIMAVKFLDSDGSGWSSDAINCIEYSLQMGARILSNSWGGGLYLQSLKNAIDAAGDAGVLFVAAAGNNNANNDVRPHYPSSYDCENIIAVLSTDNNDNKSDSSCYGPDTVDLGAPGSGILSCKLGGGYKYASGTSMATPHVAGACALALSLNSWLNYLEVKDILLQTVDPTLPGLCVSGGRLNLYEAMIHVPPPGQGFINLDNSVYSCADEVNIEMGDFHLQGAEIHDVNVTTGGGDLERVTLVEDIHRPGVFAGTISTSADPVTVKDGTLQVAHGETITATYYDSNDGTDNPATAEATATIDCVPPVISGVQVQRISSIAARIAFETDEPTTGRIRCGLSCGGPYTTVGDDLTSAVAHTIKVSGLFSETTYWFVVDAADSAGNRTIDDNGGSCYSFTTAAPAVVHVPGDFPTIQAAIDGVWDGDTVIVADGTHTGPGNRDIDFRGSAITVRSENGPDNCTIDCQGSPNEPHRGFYFHGAEQASSILAGLTITNGYVTENSPGGGCGGGIRCDNSSPTIDKCVIRDNAAECSGGGMYNFDGSSPTLTNCIFSGNSADSFGGGMHNVFHSSPTLTSCTFGGNSADSGGAAANEDNSNPMLTNCIFTQNSAIAEGGAMLNVEKCSANLTNCTFSGNSAGLFGGGVGNEHSSPTLTDCYFGDNSADFFGGGMSNNSSGPLLRNCIFSRNRANLGGGMSDVIPIWGVSSLIRTDYNFNAGETDKSWASNNTNSPTLINCTFNSNSADRGGGISNLGRSSTPTVSNCILWGDTPDEIYVLGKAPTVSYCDVEGGFSGTGNIELNPCFADTSSSDPNKWDYHLKSQAGRWDVANEVWVFDDVNSPCIDAGDPNSDWSVELWPHGKRINMGTYGGTPQASMSPLSVGSIADLNNDGNVDFGDLMLFTNKWLCDEVLLPEDLSRNGFVDFEDYTIFAESWRH